MAIKKYMRYKKYKPGELLIFDKILFKSTAGRLLLKKLHSGLGKVAVVIKIEKSIMSLFFLKKKRFWNIHKNTDLYVKI